MSNPTYADQRRAAIEQVFKDHERADATWEQVITAMSALFEDEVAKAFARGRSFGAGQQPPAKRPWRPRPKAPEALVPEDA